MILMLAGDLISDMVILDYHKFRYVNVRFKIAGA